MSAREAGILSRSLPGAPSSSTLTVIQPRRGWQPIDLRELWQYRDLLLFLTWRDIQVRYKQASLGALWAVIQPITTTIILTIAFGKLGGMEERTDVPYGVLTFCATVPWTLFATSITQAGNSLIASPNLISKVYFPRLIIPISSVLSTVLDFAIAFAALIVLMVGYGLAPHWGIVLIPAFVIQALLTALAVGLCLSALNVEYRDVRYMIPFLTQCWLLASPVGYSSREIPPSWQTLYGLNPMTGVIEGFRWALLREHTPPLGMMAASTLVILLLLVGGLFFFRRVERTFADVI